MIDARFLQLFNDAFADLETFAQKLFTALKPHVSWNKLPSPLFYIENIPAAAAATEISLVPVSGKERLSPVKPMGLSFHACTSFFICLTVGGNRNV